MRSLLLRATGLLAIVASFPSPAHATFVTAPDYAHVGDAVAYDYSIQNAVLASTPVPLVTGTRFLGGDVTFDSNGPSVPASASVGVPEFATDVGAAFAYTAPGVYHATVGGAVQTEVISSIGGLTTTYTFTPSEISPFVVVVPLADPIPIGSLLTGPTHDAVGANVSFEASLTSLIARFVTQELPAYPGLTFSRIDSVDLRFDPGGASSTGVQTWQSRIDPSFTTAYADPGFLYPTLTGTVTADFRQCVVIACQSPFALTLDVAQTHLIAIEPIAVPEPGTGILLVTAGLAWGTARSTRRGRRTVAREAERLAAPPACCLGHATERSIRRRRIPRAGAPRPARPSSPAGVSRPGRAPLRPHPAR